MKYFATGGTLIGAIRHKGFIPWDDDLDIVMKRNDYNLFIQVSNNELESKYFLQTPLTDPYYYRPFARLRNSNTTCVSKHDKKVKCNNGICIDIFPLDGFEESKRCINAIKKMKTANLCAVNYYHVNSAVNHKLIRKLIYIFTKIRYPYGLKGIFQNHESICNYYSSLNTKKLGTHFIDLGQKNTMKIVWNEIFFDEYIEVPFEYTTIWISKYFDKILKSEFGDYMSLPSIEQRNGKHNYEYDAETPYKQYLMDKYKVRY